MDALLERLDAEARFAADVAHEIKNPLASLGSAASALKAARPDQRERLMDVIEHDLRRLDRLVSDISNASRLDGELVREAEAPFDLVRLLAGLAEHLSLGAAERGVTLTSDLPRRPIVVRGLEARLAQVFVNLIDNAVSFCEPGGRVLIRARRRGERVLVSIEDTGPGIPEAALGRIFRALLLRAPRGAVRRQLRPGPGHLQADRGGSRRRGSGPRTSDPPGAPGPSGPPETKPIEVPMPLRAPGRATRTPIRPPIRPPMRPPMRARTRPWAPASWSACPSERGAR